MPADQYQEEVELPSKGRLYPEDMVPEGKVIIEMMGVQEEKLLAGSRVSPTRLMTQLLEALIVSPKLDPRQLLLQDRLFLLVKIRILTFGTAYGFKMSCPTCSVSSRYEVDLADVMVRPLPEDFTEPMEVMLPLSQKKVYLRLLRGVDEDAVLAEGKKLSEKGLAGHGDPTYVPTMARTIDHIEGSDSKDWAGKLAFCQNLKSRDSLTLQKAIERIDFGIDFKHELTCPSCRTEFQGVIPMSEEFFRPEL